jgi:hypothetical protein
VKSAEFDYYLTLNYYLTTTLLLSIIIDYYYNSILLIILKYKFTKIYIYIYTLKYITK